MRVLFLAAAAFVLTSVASAQPTPNPLAEQLQAAQAELAASPHARPEHLIAAVAAAEGRSEVNVSAFRAAMALGAWALDAQDFDLAHRAYASALGHAVGPSPAALLARNRARTGDAVTTVAQYAHAPSAAARVQAYNALQQAASELYPYAMQEGASTDVGPFQAAYAEAIGWRDYGQAADTPRLFAPMQDLGGAVMCRASWQGGDNMWRSIGLTYAGPPGVVVFRIVTDGSGAPTTVDVAFVQLRHMRVSAAEQPVGAHDFERMAGVLSRLRVVRDSSAPADCVMPRLLFQSIVLGGDVARPPALN